MRRATRILKPSVWFYKDDLASGLRCSLVGNLVGTRFRQHATMSYLIQGLKIRKRTSFIISVSTIFSSQHLSTIIMAFFISQFKSLPVPTSDCTAKTIVITGSNGGLGKEAAHHYVKLGASKLILAVRSKKKGEDAKTDIKNTTGCAKDVLEVWKIDMASYASVEEFAARLDRELPRVDIFIGARSESGCANLCMRRRRCGGICCNSLLHTAHTALAQPSRAAHTAFT